jgi:hypothetical protein
VADGAVPSDPLTELTVAFTLIFWGCPYISQVFLEPAERFLAGIGIFE